MSGHALTQLIVVIVAGMAVGAVFGLLKALRGPVGLLAYGGLIATLYAYWRMDDRYFSEGVWEITVACLAVMWLTLWRVPLLRIVLAVAVVEFGSRINRTNYPQQTLLGLGVAAAMILVATFWSPKEPKAPDVPRAPVWPGERSSRSRRTPRTPPTSRTPRASRTSRTSRRGPGVFGPYAGQRPQPPVPQRDGWSTISALVDRARGRSRTRR